VITAPPISRNPAVADSDRHGGDRWSAAAEAVAYDMAGEVIGGPAGAPESGTPA
jgi:hypothetical protein